MIWAHKDFKCRQVSIMHPDITAVVYYLDGEKRSIMLVSVYIPCITNQREKKPSAVADSTVTYKRDIRYGTKK